MRISRAAPPGPATAGFPKELGRVLLWLRPDGWQATARRNAWAAMVTDRQRRNDRTNAERDLRLVLPPSGLRVQVR